MTDIRFIVEKLNESPFNKNLSLVTFDEKSNFELLQLVNELFIEMDKKHLIDLREETDEERTYRYIEFLQLLKYPLPQEIDSFREGLLHGERFIIYPILFWSLKSLNIHKKRAYLGKYLGPLQIPQEYLGNDHVNQLIEQYKILQNDFKKYHKEYDTIELKNIKPNELKKEMNQLQDEKDELNEKINHLKKKTINENQFRELLEATSYLRKEQEEQSKLNERKRDQLIQFNLIDKKLNDTTERYKDIKNTIKNNLNPNELLNTIKHQVETNLNILNTILPNNIIQIKDKLNDLESILKEPKKNENDLIHLENEINQLKINIKNIEFNIENIQKETNDDKMNMFRKTCLLQNKKLNDKQEELNKLIKEKGIMQKNIEENELKISELSGSKFISRSDFKIYANNLRNKTNLYKKYKNELSNINIETVILHRTEQILKNKDNNYNTILKELENNKGVHGYIDTQNKLENISEKNTILNDIKSKTLQDISNIVIDINQILKDKKNKLAPLIKELRIIRQKYQDMEIDYLKKKNNYDTIAIHLENEKIKLELECNAFQQDLIYEESRYHYLNHLIHITNNNYDKIIQEIEFEKGNGRLLRDFKTISDLYKHKINQQEILSKEIRKQQKNIKFNSIDYLKQKNMFQNLIRLLKCKLKCINNNNNNINNHPISNNSLNQYSYQDNNNNNNLNNLLNSSQYDIGGANVMTIES